MDKDPLAKRCMRCAFLMYTDRTDSNKHQMNSVYKLLPDYDPLNCVCSIGVKRGLISSY